MLNLLFPKRVDNAYRGNRLAPWIFALVVLLKAYVSLYAVFNGPFMASSGDGIPLLAGPVFFPVRARYHRHQLLQRCSIDSAAPHLPRSQRRFQLYVLQIH